MKYLYRRIMATITLNNITVKYNNSSKAVTHKTHMVNIMVALSNTTETMVMVMTPLMTTICLIIIVPSLQSSQKKN